MRVEALLSLLGILLTFGTYIMILAAFTLDNDNRNFYLIGAGVALTFGTIMLGVAKIINQQHEVLRVMNDVRRTNRVQAKVLHDIAEGPTENEPAIPTSPRPNTTVRQPDGL